jgi:hypothetical protein
MENHEPIDWPCWEREKGSRWMEELDPDMQVWMDTMDPAGLVHGNVQELEEGVAAVEVEQGQAEEGVAAVEVEHGQTEEGVAEVEAEQGQADEMVVDELVVQTTTAEDGNQDVMRMKVEHGVLQVVLALPAPSLIRSTCEIFIPPPPVCNKCGVTGDVHVFVCCGCRLPVPKDLRRCDVCGNGIVTPKFWCKDYARTYGVNKDGVCFMCGRRPKDFVDDDDIVVPETED